MFVDGQFDGLNSTVGKICREFFGFGAKIIFFCTKNSIRCDFLLFRLVGSGMIIPFAIRGLALAFANGQGIVACLPFPIPILIPSKFLWGGVGVNYSSHDFPAPNKKINSDSHSDLIRCHCSEGGKGWGLRSSLFSKKKKLILERLDTQKNRAFLTQTASPTR